MMQTRGRLKRVRAPLQLFVSTEFHCKPCNIRWLAETGSRAETQQQDAETTDAEDERRSLIGNESHRQNDAEHPRYRQIGEIRIRPHANAEPRRILPFQSGAQSQLRKCD